MKKHFWPACTIVLLTLCLGCATRQPSHYNVGNAHAHNDYLQPRPFTDAYEAQFGSIEVDVFLKNDQLLVAHDTASLPKAKTIQSWYLNPLAEAIDRNNGFVYADSTKKLILLIDLKTEAEATLAKLVNVLKEYPDLRTCSSLKMVVTGNQPDNLLAYPAYLFFDGNFKRSYTHKELQRVALYSDNFKNYSKWNGIGSLKEEEKNLLLSNIKKAHAQHKPVRFWAAPDNQAAWQQLMDIGVDYINTDQIEGLSSFLKMKL